MEEWRKRRLEHLDRQIRRCDSAIAAADAYVYSVAIALAFCFIAGVALGLLR